MHVLHKYSTPNSMKVSINWLFSRKSMFLGVLSLGILINACSEPEEETEKPDTSSIEIRPDVIFLQQVTNHCRFSLKVREQLNRPGTSPFNLELADSLIGTTLRMVDALKKVTPS